MRLFGEFLHTRTSVGRRRNTGALAAARGRRVAGRIGGILTGQPFGCRGIGRDRIGLLGRCQVSDPYPTRFLFGQLPSGVRRDVVLPVGLRRPFTVRRTLAIGCASETGFATVLFWSRQLFHRH